MNGFWDVVRGLGRLIQVCAFAITTLFITIIICQFFRTIRVVLRGYPAPAPPGPRECNHDDNITGVCLKVGGLQDNGRM